MAKFNHQALGLTGDKPLVYTAMSKHLFYFRMFISKFVLEQGGIPLNPFMVFDYFLLDSIDRDIVREGNNNLVKRADEIWVFGSISDGVLAEIKIAQATKRTVRYFIVEKSRTIKEVSGEQMKFEEEIEQHRDEFLKSISISH
ncbi:MAG: hypothetical protein RL094_651 [Candidatus Parcubacteria bacterium]|jgi:hypothetical protein